MRADAVPADPRVIVQVAPAGTGGVADFVQCLRAAWQRQGIDSHAIGLSRDDTREQSLADRIATMLAIDQQPVSVLLHFSGYGYAQRGVCLWLLDELRALRARHGSALKLIVLFHETFATGPPWRSAFWVSPLQAHIAARLAAMADAVWTNTDLHARWLSRHLRDGVSIAVRAVISNVGEPQALRPPSRRDGSAIVFGLAATRQRTFDDLRAHEQTLRRIGVAEIIEVGAGPSTAHGLSSIARRHLGRLEAAALSRLLADASFGALSYPAEELAKSSVFAAYAAHGCVVLNAGRSGPPSDGIDAQVHYLDLRSIAGHSTPPTGLDDVATRLAGWYAGHGAPVHAHQLLIQATT